MKIRIDILVCALALACSAAPCQQSNFSEDKNGENALDMEEYSRAETLFKANLSKKAGGAEDGYYHAGLGESLLWQGRVSEAAKEFKQAYKIVEKTEPAASDLRARVLDDLGWLSEAQNDPAGAMANAKLALAALKPVANADPSHLSYILEHLGYLKRQAGQYSDGSDYYHQALAINAKAFGPQSLQAADDNEQLAALAWRLGNKPEGDALFNQAMQVKWNSPALFTQYTPHLYSQTVTYHYDAAAPTCRMISQNGRSHETISINGVTVSAAIDAPNKDLKCTCVSLSIINGSQNQIQFLPKAPLLIVNAPKMVISHLIDPNTLAQKVESKGEKSAKWVRFWGQDATTPVTTTFIGHPGVWGYPPIVGYNNTAPIINRNGNMTTVTTQVPDYAAQARAMEKAANLEGAAREKAQTIRSSNLSPTTLTPGNNVSGTLYFDARSFQKALLQIPIGNAIFEFQFPSTL